MSTATDAGAVFVEAVRNHQQGEYRRAAVLYRKVIARAPAHAEALHMLGLIEAQAGKLAAAADLLGRSARIRPDNPEAWNNYANALLGLRRPAEALEAYDRAIELRADYVDALLNRGNALRTLGRPAEALASYDQALLLDEASADAHCNRGNALSDLQRTDEAIDSYGRALAESPGHAEALCNRGAIRAAMQQYEKALQDFEEALRSNPVHPSALNNLGDLLSVMGRHADAARTFDRLQDAVPGYDNAAGYALHARLRCCDWSDYDPRTRQLIEAVRKGRSVAVPFALLAVSDSSRDQLRCAQLEIARKFPVLPIPLWRGERYAHKRIRVAYLSGDFHEHAVAQLAAGLYEMHDRDRFEVAAVSFGPDRRDTMRERLSKAFDVFLDVAHAGDAEVARQLREREIDIAVDLAGYTQDSRPGIFARRFAPVQVNYLGYPGTLGAEFMDYLIADRIVIPPEDARHFSERIVYLPDSYQVNDSKRNVAPLSLTRAEAGLPDAGFVFCCFNNNYKIAPTVFDVWMRLLRDVQGSVLWLLEDNPEAARNLRREAGRRGIAGERLVFAARMAPSQHLARHALADLFLDTLPYNAHTTASDALWAGLPVLTCTGSTFPGRVATSLLHAVGLPELGVASMEAYEARARELASIPADLSQLRAKLAGNRRTHPLFDTARFTRQLESAYVSMWERAERSEQPVAFTVQPELREHAS